MFCPECGTEISFEDRFCPNCGKGFCGSSSLEGGFAVTSDSNGKRRSRIPIFIVCVIVSLLVVGVVFFLFGELSKGSLEGHTAASVSVIDGLEAETYDLDLNANNGCFALEIDLPDQERRSGVSFKRLWLNGTYDCSRSGDHEVYSWTVEDVKCDGDVAQSDLDMFKDQLNSFIIGLEYDGSFPKREWKLNCGYNGSLSFFYTISVSEIGAGGTAACGALEFTQTVGDSEVGPIEVGSWWMGDQASNILGGLNGSYGFSIVQGGINVEGTIWR